MVCLTRQLVTLRLNVVDLEMGRIQQDAREAELSAKLQACYCHCLPGHPLI